MLTAQAAFLQFDQAFPALAGLGNIPLPRELAVRLFAAKGNEAIVALKKTLGRWIESGRYKSGPAVAQGPIDAMIEGSLPLDDQAAGCVDRLTASRALTPLQHDRPASRRPLCADSRPSTSLIFAANSIRAISWLLIYILQSPTVLTSLRDEVTRLRASDDPVTAAGLPARVPLLASACVCARSLRLR